LETSDCNHVFAATVDEVRCIHCNRELDKQETHSPKQKTAVQTTLSIDSELIKLFADQQAAEHDRSTLTPPVDECLMSHHDNCAPWHCSYLQSAVNSYLLSREQLLKLGLSK
jgi:hypothetical protein